MRATDRAPGTRLASPEPEVNRTSSRCPLAHMPMSGHHVCDHLDVQPSWVPGRQRVVTARLLIASALAAVTLGSCTTAHSSEALSGAPTASVAKATDPPTRPAPTTRRTSPSATPSTQPGHSTKTLGFVVTRTAVPHGYRIVLAPAKHRPDDSWAVIPGRATLTYVVPRSLVDTASLLSGVIQVTAQGHRVTGVVIIGG